MVSPRETKTPSEVKPDSEIHIRVSGDTKDQLKDAADLAHKMDLIEKPELTLLMNLFVGWGMNVLKKLWLDRMGYK